MAPRVAIVGSCVVWLWCLTSPVFYVGGVGGGEVGEAAVENAVLASGPSVRLLYRSSVRFEVGVGGCCRCAAAASQLLVGNAVEAPE